MNRGKNTEDYWKQKHIKEIAQGSSFENMLDKIDESDHLTITKVAADILKENEDAFRRKSLLEIGSGKGHFSAYVKRRLFPIWEVEAWDFSESGIEYSKKNCPEVDYKLRDFLLNPVDKDYGVICMFETIEHIEEGTNYKVLDNILDHCEYAIISTPDIPDDCFGEHISHYQLDTFENRGYDVVWKSYLSEIYLPDGVYHYMIFLIKGKLSEGEENE